MRIFYTDSEDDNSDYVDYLEISHITHELRLYINLSYLALGSCDIDGNEDYEWGLCRTTFYALIDGMQAKGYTLIKTVYDRN